MHQTMNALRGALFCCLCFQAEDGIRDHCVTGVQTCALPILLDPLNRSGDQEGSKWSDGEVRTPKGFRDAYRQFAEGGWNALPCEPDWGGQGLPKLVATPVDEMWTSANMSFSLCPLLTQGAVHALALRGSQKLQPTYSPKMVAGGRARTPTPTQTP